MAPRTRTRSKSIPPPISFRMGFAGPRRLGRAGEPSGPWEPQLRTGLEVAARGIRARLEPGRALCLIGSLAQGADLALAESFVAHGAVLRVWLPEPLDRFANVEDFPEARARERLAALVRDRSTAELRVVSTAGDRRERFVDCATHVVRETEAMLCVRHWDAANGRGGTEESVALARALGRPVVEVRLREDPALDAEVVFPPEWAPRADARPLPFDRPNPRATVAAWKQAASAEAGRSKHLVVRAAAWTVALQLGATVLAVVTYHRAGWELTGLLAKLCVILGVAAITLWTSRRAVASRWADRRFLAELHRSWSAVRGYSGSASWFEEDLPAEFASHGRDLALLHGLDREADATGDVRTFRERYASERLAAQRAYAERTAKRAHRSRAVLRGIFHVLIAATLVALITKLVLEVSGAVAAWPRLDAACVVVEILGPACGAAAVSFVALLDLTARHQTQARLSEFLEEQRRELAGCADWNSTRHLVAGIERRLLEETKGWYARHAFRK